MIILFIAFMLVGWAVQSKLKSKFKKYSATKLSNGMSGKEVAVHLAPFGKHFTGFIWLPSGATLLAFP